MTGVSGGRHERQGRWTSSPQILVAHVPVTRHTVEHPFTVGNRALVNADHQAALNRDTPQEVAHALHYWLRQELWGNGSE